MAAEPLPSGTLTAMFTDIVDSTRLKGSMPADTEGRRDAAFRTTVKDPHDKRVLAAVKHAGGRKVKSTGDGFLFAFTDAEEAVLCALAIQHSLRDEPITTPLGPLQLRIGLHTGTAHATGNDYAARVEQQAQPGDVLLSPQTKAIVAQLRNVTFEETATADLKGLDATTLFRAIKNADAGSNAALLAAAYLRAS